MFPSRALGGERWILNARLDHSTRIIRVREPGTDPTADPDQKRERGVEDRLVKRII